MPRFRNIDDASHMRAFRHLVRWKLGLGPPGGPDELAPPVRPRARGPQPGAPSVANDGRALRESGQRPSLTWIGHATYLVRLGGASILTDPVLGPRIAVIPRLVAPGLAQADMPPIDVVTVSHNHRDHMDAPSLRALGPRPLYVVPAGLGAWFRREGFPRVVELGWWESTDVEGLRITFVPSQHWSRRGLLDEDETLWGGFVLESGGVRVYHSGDTAYFSGFRAIRERAGPIDAAMLPIGAYEPRWFMRAQHMNPDDAVQAWVDLDAARMVAMHWGTFQLTDEPTDEPPLRTRAVVDERSLDDRRLFIPAIGETLWL